MKINCGEKRNIKARNRNVQTVEIYAILWKWERKQSLMLIALKNNYWNWIIILRTVAENIKNFIMMISGYLWIKFSSSDQRKSGLSSTRIRSFFHWIFDYYSTIINRSYFAIDWSWEIRNFFWISKINYSQATKCYLQSQHTQRGFTVSAVTVTIHSVNLNDFATQRIYFN